MKDKNAALILADGTIVFGNGFGACTTRIGELVFNTAMQGYQESLTDPSYAGQILISTYPLIGNYGINNYSNESEKIHVEGYAIQELCTEPEHMDSVKTLNEFLENKNKPGICGIDTRFLVRKLRTSGVMPAIIAVSEKEKPLDIRKLVESLKFDYANMNFIKNITVKKPMVYGHENKKKIVMLDYGAKNSMINELVKRNLKVIRVPAYTDIEEIKSFEPDGIVLSSGPGNPAVLEPAYKTIRKLDYPIFGICLGNQLIAHAFGGDTYKLKFGHRGVNQPVINLKDKKVRITTQNHGFAIRNVPKDFEITEKNANDGSIEGMEHKDGHIFSVQYHPEATPGPNDTKYLFDKFAKMIK